jgi:hypothetical protein
LARNIADRSAQSIAQNRRVPEQFQTADGKSGGQSMKKLPTADALVAGYWRKLARSIERPTGNQKELHSAPVAPTKLRKIATGGSPTFSGVKT